MTPADLIRLALRDAGVNGVGQSPKAEDTNDAFTHLNMMLAQWTRKRWFVYHLIDTAVTSTGAQSYTVGAGGAFNIARVDRLEAAYFRLLQSSGNSTDYALTLLDSYEDYSRIVLKSLTSWPQYAFLDSGYPTGTLYVWPVPAASTYSLHILTKAPLTAFPDLTTDINLPPEYLEALLYSLGERLRLSYQLPPDQALASLARAARNTLIVANTQPALLQLPGGLARRGDSGAIYSGGSA